MATFVDVEDESILENIFKDSFPDSWNANPDFLQYLAQLSSYGLEKLSKEPERLCEERSQILEDTQDLAFHNYKTFIQTADCSREIYQDFKIIENLVGSLLDKLPDFHSSCNGFLKTAQNIATSRKMNSLTLQRHTQLLEILEIPQLMDTCVRNGYYDESLELIQHVKRWEKKFSHIPVIVEIVQAVRSSAQFMLQQLIRQLRSNVQLPACLRIIGYLRRMDVFLEPELRIKFLQARDSWFQGVLAGVPTDDPYSHITKTIELSRVHLFDIITQYRAIFSDDDPWLSPKCPNEAALFHGWVVQKVSQFIKTLEADLRAGVGGRLDSVLGQCMYFGLSFSRVGADFRGLLVPVFQRAAFEYFRVAVETANTRFESSMQIHNLLSAPATNYAAVTQADALSPPTSLLDHHPLAAFCNLLLHAFNDLRLCAPLALVCDIAATLENSMNSVNNVILAFHRAEESAFDDREQAAFARFCEAFISDLVPYVNRCLQAVFPAPQVASMLGVTVTELRELGNVGVMNEANITRPIQHLLPRASNVDATNDITEKSSYVAAADQSNPAIVDPEHTTVQSDEALQDNVTSQSTIPSPVDADSADLGEKDDTSILSSNDKIGGMDTITSGPLNAANLTDENSVIDLDRVFQTEDT